MGQNGAQPHWPRKMLSFSLWTMDCRGTPRAEPSGDHMSGRGYHFTREYSVDPFELARLREVRYRNVPTVPAAMKLSEISDHIAQGDVDLSRRQGTLIVDDQNQLVGIITRGDIVPKCWPAKLSEHEPPPSFHPMRPRWREPPRPRRSERSVSAAHRTEHHLRPGDLRRGGGDLLRVAQGICVFAVRQPVSR